MKSEILYCTRVCDFCDDVVDTSSACHCAFIADASVCCKYAGGDDYRPIPLPEDSQ